ASPAARTRSCATSSVSGCSACPRSPASTRPPRSRTCSRTRTVPHRLSRSTTGVTVPTRGPAGTGGEPMRYLFLLNSPDGGPPADPDETRRLYEEYGRATEAMAAAGVLIECAPLTPAVSATTVRV